jgi:hypothetical protein
MKSGNLNFLERSGSLQACNWDCFSIKGAKHLSSSTPQMEAARGHIQYGDKVNIYDCEVLRSLMSLTALLTYQSTEAKEYFK